MLRAHLRPGFRPLPAVPVGSIEKATFAPRTNRPQHAFRRILKRYEMIKPDAQTQSKERLAFAKRFANDKWQVDTLVGPYASDEQGHPRQTRLIAFLDDASRVCCHGQFFFEETHATLKVALRAALFKRGVPRTLYTDNGSIYTGKDLTLICGRLGCLLCHAPVRDAAAKGKIERWLREVREQFLCRQLDLSSLRLLNEQFIRWVEDQYLFQYPLHPGDEADRPLRPDPAHQSLSGQSGDELFYSETTRSVKADNTFLPRCRRYEALRDLRSREILVRFDPGEAAAPLVIYLGSERLGAFSSCSTSCATIGLRPKPHALAQTAIDGAVTYQPRPARPFRRNHGWHASSTLNPQLQP